LAVPAALADDVVYGGIDVWRTPGNGGTFYDFSADPLPAGFFCQRSQPFSERVVLQGAPLATSKAATPEGIICSAHVTLPLPMTIINVPAMVASRHWLNDGDDAPRKRAKANSSNPAATCREPAIKKGGMDSTA